MALCDVMQYGFVFRKILFMILDCGIRLCVVGDAYIMRYWDLSDAYVMRYWVLNDDYVMQYWVLGDEYIMK